MEATGELSVSEKRVILMRFVVCWFACCITPICIGLVQAFEYGSPLILVGMICDVYFCIEAIWVSGVVIEFYNYICSVWPGCSRLKYMLSNNVAIAEPHPDNNATSNGQEAVLLLEITRSSLPLLCPVIAHAAGAHPIVQIWLTVPRILKVYDLMNLCNTLKLKFSEFSALRYDTVNRCFLTAIITTIYASSLAAIWFYISCKRKNQCSDSDSWVSHDEVLREQNLFSIYIRSMHFVIQTLFTVGYGDSSIVNNKEYAFSLFLILNGSLYYAFLISSITSLLSNKDITTKEFRADLSNIKSVLLRRNVPETLRLRIVQFLQFSMSRQRGFNENIFFRDIPKSLLYEIKTYHTSQLRQVPFFKNLSDVFLEQCVHRLSYRTYVPGTIVFFQNEIFREILLVMSGKIDLKVRSAKAALFTCMAGDCLGDFQMIFGNPSEVGALAITFTEVLVLSYERFLDAIKSYNLGTAKSAEEWMSDQNEALQATIDSHKDHLQKVEKVFSNIEGTTKNKRMLAMMEDLVTSKASWIIMPDSLFHPIWAGIALLGMSYYMFAIPLRILRYYQCSMETPQDCLSSWDYSLVVDYMWDLFFLVDVVLQFAVFAYVGYENDQQVFITDRRQIFARYWSSPYSIISVLAFFPLDLLAIDWGYLLCLRLSKLLWLFYCFDKLALIFDYFEHFSSQKRALLNSEGVAIVRLAILTFVVMLWTSVGWAILRHESDDQGFIASIYWTMTTMTTVGYGDIIPETNFETLFTVIFCIVGPLYSATIIANAASFFSSSNVSVDNIDYRQVVVKAYLDSVFQDSAYSSRSTEVARLKKVKPSKGQIVPGGDNDTQEQINNKRLHALSYLEYVARERNGLDENKIISNVLPDYLQNSLKQARVMDTLMKAKFFSQLNAGFLRDVMMSSEVRYIPEGYIVVYHGSYIPGCYTIMSGNISMKSSDGDTKNVLSTGDSFASINLFEDVKSDAKVIAISDCEILLLRRLQFQEILKAHGAHNNQEAIKHMKTLAKQDSDMFISAPPLVRNESLKGNEEWRENFMIDTKSRYYLLWAIFQTVITMINIIILPARFAYMESFSAFWSNFLVMDYLSDGAYMLDICLRRYYLVYYDYHGPVFSQKERKRVYEKEGHFILHCIAAVPFEFIVLLTSSAIFPGLSMQQSIAVYRFNRLLRCVDLPSSSKVVDMSLGSYFSSSSKLIMKMFFMLFAMVILAHIFGCVFFVVGNLQHLYGRHDNWADDLGILRDCSAGAANHSDDCDGPPSLLRVMTQYVYSIYWATATLTTVGYGDLSAVSGTEQTFAILVFLVGTAAYTVIVTNLEAIMSHLDVTSDIFQSRQMRLQNFLSRERVSEGFSRKNDLYQQKLWNLQRGAQCKEIKEYLPPFIYSDIMLSATQSKLKKLFFFRVRSSEFINDVSSRLITQVYLSSDTIFHCGEAANKFYLIRSGTVAMINESTGMPYEKILDGEDKRLGNSEFFLRSIYKCTAQSATDSDVVLFELNFQQFWEVVERHGLEKEYLLQVKAEEEDLVKNSTDQLVARFKALRSNAKVSAMMFNSSMPTIQSADEVPILLDSWLYHSWVAVSIALTLYIAISVPYFIVFPEAELGTVICDSIMFVFFALDILLRMRYFAMSYQGELITTRQDVFNVYMRKYFTWDMLSTLPIGLLVYAVTQNNRAYSLLRGMFLLKISYLNPQVHHMLEVYSLSYGTIAPDKVRVTKLILSVCYLGHVSSCIFCLIGLGAAAKGVDNWIEFNDYKGLSPLSLYLRGYYWAFYTIVTVGFGSISMVSGVERVFAMSLMIIGAIICDAGITAMFSSIIANTDKLSGITRRSKEAIMQFCQSHKYSNDIQKKLTIYYDYLSNDLQNSVEEKDFDLLPPPLQYEFTQIHAFDSLCSLCLLDTDNADTQLGFVYSLMRHMVVTISIPGQVILGVSDLDVHILRRGRAYARLAGKSTTRKRDYYQEGEALCRSRLNTASLDSPGKLVVVNLFSLESQGSANMNVVTDGFNRANQLGRRISTHFFGRKLSRRFAMLLSHSVHARLACGARKMTSTYRAFTPSGPFTEAVSFDEEFNFHVPKSAPTVQVFFMDDRRHEDGGYFGKVNIDLANIDSMPEVYKKTPVIDAEDHAKAKESSNPNRAKEKGEAGPVKRVLQRLYSSMSGDRLQESHPEEKPTEKSTELPTASKPPKPRRENTGTRVKFSEPELDDDELFSFDDEKPSSEAATPDCYMYQLKVDVLDKHGNVQGVADLALTIRGGVSGYSQEKKSKVLSRAKQMSCMPSEAVAESFCHLFTLPAEKITELRSFYKKCFAKQDVATIVKESTKPKRSRRVSRNFLSNQRSGSQGSNEDVVQKFEEHKDASIQDRGSKDSHDELEEAVGLSSVAKNLRKGSISNNGRVFEVPWS